MHHYIKLRNLLHENKKFKEFRAKFDCYSIGSRTCYLNLLLLNVLGSIRDEVALFLELLISYPSCYVGMELVPTVWRK